MNAGSLRNLINDQIKNEQNHTPEFIIIKIAFKTLKGLIDLEKLHAGQRVAHRDLRPENIVLDKFSNIKIIDFDNSKCFTVSHNDKNSQNKLRSSGDRRYFSP